MLQILFGILKIIGILLLAVLGIVLLLLLVILLVPVRYRAEVAFDGKPLGTVDVTWLLRLLRVRIRYEDGLRWMVHVACFRVKEGGEASDKKTSEEKHFDSEDALDEMWMEDGECLDDAGSVGGSGEIGSNGGAGNERGAATASADSGTEKETSTASEDKGTDKRQDTVLEDGAVEAGPVKTSLPERLWKKLRSILQNVSEKFRSLWQTLQTKTNALQEKYEEIRALVTDEANQKTFRLLCRQVKKLLRHLLPTKCRGRVRFGFEDPATTGQILMYLSPFYGWYRDALRIEPVFDETITEGELWMKGRIRIGTLLWIVIRLFLDKNFRKLLKRRKK